MPAGRKNVLVTIQAPTFVPDEQGGEIASWVAVGPRVWAEVATVTGPERWAAGQVMAAVTRTVTIWYARALAGAQPTWRIVWGARMLQIQAVENVNEQNRELRFLCVEIQGAPA